MQTQDASSELLFKLWPWLEANKKGLIIGVVVAGLAVAGYSFLSAQRSQNEAAAGKEFTDLLFSPAASSSAPQFAGAFAKVAASHPGTAAAERAQLQAGATLFNAGQYAEAQTQFQKFLNSENSGGALAATAQLGVAASLEALDKPEALTAYQKVVAGYAGTVSAEVAKQAVARLTPKAVAAPAATPAAVPAAAPATPSK
jgi:predicted negative regulator of RcsB-dependent stress response